MEPEQAARTFIAAWNVDDEGERRVLLAGCCDPGARFVSTQGDTTGLDAFNASVGAFRRAFPRVSVVMGEPDCHHGFARFRWETHWNDGRETLIGEDFVSFSLDGRITLVVSFDGESVRPTE